MSERVPHHACAMHLQIFIYGTLKSQKASLPPHYVLGLSFLVEVWPDPDKAGAVHRVPQFWHRYLRKATMTAFLWSTSPSQNQRRCRQLMDKILILNVSKLRSSSGAAIAGPHSFADHLTNRRAVSANIINHICRSVIPIVPLIDILKHFDSSAGKQLQSIIYGVLVFHGAKQQQPAAQQRRTTPALISPATPRLGPGALLPISWCHASPLVSFRYISISSPISYFLFRVIKCVLSNWNLCILTFTGIFNFNRR